MAHSDFTALIGKVREGDQTAAAALFEQYEAEVRAMIRARMPKLLRSRLDSVDFAQDVWKSFLLGDHGLAAGIETPDRFRRYVNGMVKNKVLMEYRRRTLTEKCDAKREQPLFIQRGDRVIAREVVSHDPTPSAPLRAQERFDQLTLGRSPIDKQIVELRSQGYTVDEIGKQVGRDERTVRRVLDGVKAAAGGVR